VPAHLFRRALDQRIDCACLTARAWDGRRCIREVGPASSFRFGSFREELESAIRILLLNPHYKIEYRVSGWILSSLEGDHGHHLLGIQMMSAIDVQGQASRLYLFLESKTDFVHDFLYAPANLDQTALGTKFRESLFHTIRLRPLWVAASRFASSPSSDPLSGHAVTPRHWGELLPMR
jgi:hypothetical protein